MLYPEGNAKHPVPTTRLNIKTAPTKYLEKPNKSKQI